MTYLTLNLSHGSFSCLEVHLLESQVPTVRVLSLPPMQLGFRVEGWLCVLGEGRTLNDRQLSLQGLSLWIPDLPIQTLSSLMKRQV